MDAWTYTNRGWEAMSPPWRGDIADSGNADIARWGYRRVMALSDTDGPHALAIYGVTAAPPDGPGQQYPYLVMHTISGMLQFIFLTCYPDLIELLGKLAPMQQAIAATSTDMRLHDVQQFTGTSYVSQEDAADAANNAFGSWREDHPDLLIAQLSTAASCAVRGPDVVYAFTISVFLL